MAWHAELKRRGWHCINHTDMVRFFHNSLNNNWEARLAKGQKQQMERYKKLWAELNQGGIHDILNKLLMMTDILKNVCQRKIPIKD